MPVDLLRHPPTQERSRERLRRVLDTAEEILADHGPTRFTTNRIAEAAGIPIGSIYRFFEDKESIVEALALRYWRDFEELVADLAEADAREPFANPIETVLDALADGFRDRPGFLALWFGGLRSERVRDATRDARTAISSSIERIFATHWPDAPSELSATAAAIVVLAGDGLLREAFRRDRDGDPRVLGEGKLMLEAYAVARLGERRR